MISSLHFTLLCAIIGLTDARLFETERELEAPLEPVTFISSNETAFTVNVKLRQTLVGSPRRCFTKNTVQSADTFFVVYTDPTTRELTCEIFRDANACFEKDLVIGCDKYRNVAEIQVYTRDELFTTQDKVTNPKVDNCLGMSEEIGKTKKSLHSFECLSSGDSQDCDLDSDCPSGYHCSSFGCDAYAKVGEQCGYYDLNNWNLCDPATSYCDDPMSCIGDFRGTCVAYRNKCTTTEDCRSNFYCDTKVNRCVPRNRDAGECCTDHVLQCKPSLTCTPTLVDEATLRYSKICA